MQANFREVKNVLILHGAGNDSQGNWVPWLKEKLEKKRYKVWTPDLPNSDLPKLKPWLKAIFSNKERTFNSESLIVGHSAGATLVLRILENLPKGVKIHKAILVAGVVELGTLTEYFKYKKDLIENGFNWHKIKNTCKNFIFIHSDNDHYQCGEDQGRIMQKNLGGRLIVIKGEDHFNLEKSPKYKQFPALLKCI